MPCGYVFPTADLQSDGACLHILREASAMFVRLTMMGQVQCLRMWNEQQVRSSRISIFNPSKSIANEDDPTAVLLL